jgi:Xaa-Pro aminopeptidase
MNRRLKNLLGLLQKNKLDAYLVMKDINIRYLTDFPACESWLLVTTKGCFYITDFRYVLEAKKGLKGVKVEKYDKSFYKTLFDIMTTCKIKRLGIDERHLNVVQYKTLKKLAPAGVEIIEANNLVEDLREIKDSEEIKAIREALLIHDEALDLLKKVVKPGVTERDVFKKLDEFVRDENVGYSFPPIIASGPNSCYPHAKITDRMIQNNEPVLIDMGIDYQGYKSDLTRMFFLGRIPPLVEDVNDYVAEAQQKAIKAVRAGLKVSDLDKVARNSLKQHKLAQYFGHALGHGVGLEIHESPRLSQQNEAVLKEGMVITIEPAVYIPNKFGIRLEEMVLVNKKDCEVLSEHIY